MFPMRVILPFLPPFVSLLNTHRLPVQAQAARLAAAVHGEAACLRSAWPSASWQGQATGSHPPLLLLLVPLVTMLVMMVTLTVMVTVMRVLAEPRQHPLVFIHPLGMTVAVAGEESAAGQTRDEEERGGKREEHQLLPRPWELVGCQLPRGPPHPASRCWRRKGRRRKEARQLQ